MLKVLLVLLAMAASASMETRLGEQGGEARSPDGQWVIRAVPLSDGGDPPRLQAVLSGPGVQARPLMRYQRLADVVWQDGKVVLIERTVSFARVRAFALAPDDGPADSLQLDIVRGMARRMPRIGQVQDRQYRLGTFDSGLCIAVEESGPSPGRGLSQLITRRGAFRLDLTALRAQPVNICPPLR